MILSKHSKQRMSERASVKTGKAKLFRAALKNGLSIGEAKNKGMSKTVICYLAKLNKNQKAKIYKGYVFIYSKGNHKLYTMYECPKNIQEELINYDRGIQEVV